MAALCSRPRSLLAAEFSVNRGAYQILKSELIHRFSLSEEQRAEIVPDGVAILADKILEVTPPTPLHPTVNA
ncbi:hypothetical protein L9F63_023979, partial [Diploptera punctata]